MTPLTASPPTLATLADLLERLGGISPRRVLMQPPPGTANEEDLLRLDRQGKGLYELVEGVLVEKAVGYRESLLAIALGSFLQAFVRSANLGVVSGEAGMMRLFPHLVRIPDLAFASWNRFPDRKVPSTPIPDLVPDLAVEIVSESNTEQEMARKRGEYFGAGVRLVWEIDPRKRMVAVYTGPENVQLLDETGTLLGGDVLPGFELPLKQLFAELDRHGNG